MQKDLKRLKRPPGQARPQNWLKLRCIYNHDTWFLYTILSYGNLHNYYHRINNTIYIRLYFQILINCWININYEIINIRFNAHYLWTCFCCVLFWAEYVYVCKILTDFCLAEVCLGKSCQFATCDSDSPKPAVGRLAEAGLEEI